MTIDQVLTGTFDWSAAAIDEACESAYLAYKREVTARHIAYFAARPNARDPERAWAASSRVAAFPEGHEQLAGLLPDNLWHRFHLFGGSSQVLAITLLAAASKADPGLSWLSDVGLGTTCGGLFEVELAPDVLNERPRQTTIDWLVLGADGVIAAEAKFTEKGFGTCSCERRAEGVCAERVDVRPYWDVASSSLGIRRTAGWCALSILYQPVRNIAAADLIAGSRPASFLLLYDARNPYFNGAEKWPGWHRILKRLAVGSRVAYRGMSWQELLGRVGLERRALRWAAEKHGLTEPTPL